MSLHIVYDCFPYNGKLSQKREAVQSLNCLLYGHLQKKFANIWSRLWEKLHLAFSVKLYSHGKPETTILASVGCRGK